MAFSTVATISFCVLASLPGSLGLRKGNRGDQEGVKGRVDELYLLGAPGPFWSPPENLGLAAGVDCFPGVRLINFYGRREWWKPSTLDIVPSKTSLAGLKHFRMDVGKSDINLQKYQVEPCSNNSAVDPWGAGTVALHLPSSYEEGKSFLPPRLSTMVSFARAAYRDDPVLVDEQLKAYGYRVAATATSQTSWKQVSHLTQNVNTLSCTLTFHGTESLNDWIANFRARWVNFCSLETTVHLGFKEQLLRMVTNPEFQSNIRPKLPYCKSLTVAGHSMGGAIAELLAACLAKAPENDPDYELVRFMKETPKLMVPVE